MPSRINNGKIYLSVCGTAFACGVRLASTHNYLILITKHLIAMRKLTAIYWVASFAALLCVVPEEGTQYEFIILFALIANFGFATFAANKYN